LDAFSVVKGSFLSSLITLRYIFFVDFLYFLPNIVNMKAKNIPIHTRIKELRKEKGWTQSDLAKNLELENKMISYYENGKSIPNADTLIRIAEVFDVSIDYLLIEDVPRLPLERTGNNELLKQMYEIDKLTEKDIELVSYMISSLITKNKIKELATKAS